MLSMFCFVKSDADVKGIGWLRQDKQCSSILHFGPRIFLRCVKDQQMHHPFNVLVLNVLLHVSAF
jgi:hypothetical protein